MNARLLAFGSILAATLFGCSRTSAPVAAPMADVSAAAVDAATEAPARAVGLKLGFAFTTNLMGELEPCG
jgi:hypothetical protein